MTADERKSERDAMSDHVTLMGAEKVERAANTMREAANEMSRAVGALEYALQTHQRSMDDWLDRLERVLAESRKAPGP